MRLWTEYEGETIDGAFPLKRLLLPEGRSAFFSTANGKGDPALLRLIECHFDEDEIIARWRCVEALCHPNFLKLERYGQIELDGGPGVYALFEKADANLAEVLAQDRLSMTDAAQLAASLVAALEMLHTHGFVHEHVAAQNIFAVGETVKLRSDCIREAPEGHAGVDAKQRDVHDLAVVILQALTQTFDPERAAGLPAPFDKVVRNGLSGTWGLAEIRSAVGVPPRPSPATAPAKPAPAASAPKIPSPEKIPAPVAATAAKPAAATPAPPASAPATKPLPSSKPQETRRWGDDNLVRNRMRQVMLGEPLPRRFSFKSDQGMKWAGVAAMVVILSLMVGWLVAHEDRHRAGHAAASPVSSAAGIDHSGPARAPQSQLQEAQGREAQGREAQGQGAQARTQWRVIAYTYNHRDQAQKKAATLAKMHPGLHPQVFTPTGRAPYLVTMGGAMNKDEAFAFARRLRSRGLPRDTYAQNYDSAAR